MPVTISDDGFRIRFPKTISYLLRHFYGVSFGCRTARIPAVVKTLPTELIVEAIKAFMDDEASVGHSYIRAISVNPRLLSDIRELIFLLAERQGEAIQDHVTEIKARDRGRFTFCLNKPVLKWYEENINFVHNEKKLKLAYLTRRKSSKKRRTGFTRSRVLALITETPKTITALEKETGLTRSSISLQLQKLLEQNEISFIRRGKNLSWQRNENFSC
ncbi:MAG: hypothetical protein V1817_04325 [Candidatus Micrarchaeota archaeon]